MARTVGLVTIGRAPRADLVEEYEPALAGAAIIQVGARITGVPAILANAAVATIARGIWEGTA
jgi:hypothetical protein